MIAPFDIFRVMQDIQPLGLEPASTLDDAKARVNELGKSRPGEYIIFSQKTGHKISIMVAATGKARKVMLAKNPVGGLSV